MMLNFANLRQTDGGFEHNLVEEEGIKLNAILVATFVGM